MRLVWRAPLHRGLFMPLATVFLSAAIAVVGTPALGAQKSVRDSVHNLSASGPGTIRAQSEQQICIFCHAPHNTTGQKPLWNRRSSVANYTIYQSSTMDATAGQPTGSSKKCLSCHDGTIALGAVVSRAQEIAMAGSQQLPAGLSNLGTDLSDDHPISFAYTQSLANADPQLLGPATLPPEIRLDPAQMIQCTTCHDAHDNSQGKFLVRSNVQGALCTACHRMDGWAATPHRLSTAAVSGDTPAAWPYLTVAENACRSCHRSHSAGGHQRLLIFDQEENNCLSCHDGQVARTNLDAEITKFSAHNPRKWVRKHDPKETLVGASPHVECADCHNGHAVLPQAPLPLGTYVAIGATLTKMSGITLGGAPVPEARFEYEVCMKCHGDTPVRVPRKIQRVDRTDNLRLKLTTTNPSYHPVFGPVASTDTVSLVPELPQGSRIRCTDCHNNNDGPRNGGNGPDGPHGSIYNFLLEREYRVTDQTTESLSTYALCYKCHSRTSILDNESFPYHRLHIVEENTPCSVCHDPHGVRPSAGVLTDATHLINFDVTIVRPDPGSGRIEFRDLGRFRGSCTLQCHGETHENEQYGR